MVAFYEDPENNRLATPSGKLEFYSQRLADNFPGDEERKPVPQYIAEGTTHKESKSCDRAKKYPLLLVSNHPRWRVHAEHDDISWLREIETCKVKGQDGYLYEPVWIHPSDAEERGIKHGDIVSLFNERGIILGGAYVTERIIPGAVYQDHGARVDPIVPGKIDRGGSNNLISPTAITSKNCAGMATSGFLVEVEKTDMEDLRKRYPEAFEQEYDPATGPSFVGRVTGGNK
jgi:trimethylamine-N-oxide reductase (cytochrome c)